MNKNEPSIVEDQWLEFGRRIRARRENLRLSQEEAAARISMTRQQWHRIEKGASTKRTTVAKLATALECDPAEVLHWAGFQSEALNKKITVTGERAYASLLSPFPATADLRIEELLLHYFRSLPVEVQSSVMAHVGSLYLKYRGKEEGEGANE